MATAIPEIRVVEAADRAALVELWDRCDLTRPWNDPDRDIDRRLTVDDRLFLAAVVDDHLIGSVMAGYDGHRGWINYLAVAPDHRHTGIASSLMASAESRLRELGCAKINLQIRRQNHDAIGFYESLGFGIDDVVSMGKRLVSDEPGIE